MLGLRKIIKMFETGNVCVSGLKGTGKDMLFANVINRRKKPYVSNTNYGGLCFPFRFSDIDCGENTFNHFISGDLSYYEYPFPDGTDIYLADCGVYFPSQYCNELNQKYKFFPGFMALSRHLGDCNVHFNIQNLNRCWDKIREQSDQYINCQWCKVFFGKLVIQTVRIYEMHESAVRRVPPFRLRRPLLSLERIQQWEIQKQNYDIAYGKVDSMLLIYFNRSIYDTRIFKEMLRNGKKKE